jgi:copper(I)-binding protein
MTLRMALSGMATSLALAFVVPGPALAHEYEAGDISVAHPWARATPGGAKVGAAFMEIKAKDGVADTLVSASTPAAGRVEIHTHIMDDGVMKMRRIENLPVGEGKSVVLRPSGDHIMLFDLKAPLKEGDLLPLTLVFEKAGEIKIEATVEPVGAKGPHGMDHQPGHEAGGGSDHGQH